MASGKPKDLKSGENIVIGGLLLQIFFFGFFIIVAIVFDRKIQKHPTTQSSNPSIPWRKHLIALYFASALILVRNVFRIVEYVQGNDGYILRHEYYLYIFDATLMFFVMLAFNVVHPSEVHALLKGGMVSRGFQMIAFKEIESQESPLTEESGEA
jgi:uncharacterized membrane protein